MKNLQKFFLAASILFFINCYSQDTLRVKQTITILKNQDFKVNPGTVIVLSPETRIWVEGGLNLIGTKEQPIQIISESVNNPGIGISINGNSNKQSINIEFLEIKGLVQAIRFEPFWYRKSVKIKNLKISKCSFSESSIYVSTPILDQRNKGIQFSLKNSLFYNNNSGVILEEFGNKNLFYDLDELAFFENQFSGIDNSLGVLHLNLSNSYKKSNYKIGNLLFNRNQIESNEVGISVSGTADSIFINKIFLDKNKRPIFDFYVDPRLPRVIYKEGKFEDWKEYLCLISEIKQELGIITLLNLRCNVLALLDSNGIPIKFEQNIISNNNLINFNYLNNPTNLTLENGIQIKLPTIDNSIILKKDSLLYIEKKAQSDSILIAKNEVFNKNYEIGIWGGFSSFLGDVKHKYGVPGCLDWTGGIYLQYNYKRNFSIRANYYRTDIGMHDPTAPLFLFQSAPAYINDVNGSLTELTSWETSFRTKINSLEFQTIWFLGNKLYQKSNNDKGKFIAGISFGLGIMHYTPYRGAIYGRDKDSVIFVEARPLGFEGQNFIPNMQKYGSWTFNISTGLDLNYIYKKWKFKTEIRFVMTGTDYLDDMGTGYMYGGNYDEWLKSNKDWVGPINKSTGKPIKLDETFSRKNASSTRRTTDLLPDGYFQLHFGCSYEIDDLILSVKSKIKKKAN